MISDNILELSAADNSSLDDRFPLLFIHGWNLGRSPDGTASDSWKNFLDYFYQQSELNLRFKPYFVEYQENYMSIENLAVSLHNAVLEMEQKDSQFSGKDIYIIGHCLGGLIARAFMNLNHTGERVPLLITLGAPHHGTPLANGPARNDKVNSNSSFLLEGLDDFLFPQINYNEVNRSDFLWDNYDDFFDLEKFPDEMNHWLADSLNKDTTYDHKIICYSGKWTGKAENPPLNSSTVFYAGSYLISSFFLDESDGFIPHQSAVFSGHHPLAVKVFHDYHHLELVTGKSSDDDYYFNFLKDDLLGFGQTSIIDSKEKTSSSDLLDISCFPNPFSKEITVQVFIREKGYVQLSVYDIMGRKIKTLLNQELMPGIIKKSWNGKNSKGVPVSSGFYFISLEKEGILKTEKIYLLK